MARIRQVSSPEERERLVDDLLTRGYRIERRTQSSIKLKATDYGEAIHHIFLFFAALLVGALVFDLLGLPAGSVWLVAILSNVCYAGHSWFTAEEIVIKLEQ